MAKKVIKKSERTPEEKQIQIPKPALKTVTITIVGNTSLLVNRFDEKCMKEIEEKYRGKAKKKELEDLATAEQEYLRSLYVVKGNVGAKGTVYGIPAAGLKNCAVSACRFVDGVTMTVASGAFHVVNDFGGLVPIICKDGPEMDERMVRVGNFGNKKPATRRRGRFDKWEIEFDIMYNSGVISAEQLLNLYENAGFSIGLCEYRPEKKGNLGMFSVKRK